MCCTTGRMEPLNQHFRLHCYNHHVALSISPRCTRRGPSGEATAFPANDGIVANAYTAKTETHTNSLSC